MAKKSSGWKAPFDYEGLSDLMHKRRCEVDEELRALHERAAAIKESILSRKTRRGKPLTERGLRRLFRELQSVDAKSTILFMEGSSIAKQQAVHQHNDWIHAITSARKTA